MRVTGNRIQESRLADGFAEERGTTGLLTLLGVLFQGVCGKRENGNGTQALLCFPLADGAGIPSLRTRAKCTGKSVLIADDDSDTLRLLEFLMAREGYVVETADGAEGAMALLYSFTPDAVLMDIRLPAMDGLQLTRLIKLTGKANKIPILAVSASDTATTSRRHTRPAATATSQTRGYQHICVDRGRIPGPRLTGRPKEVISVIAESNTCNPDNLAVLKNAPRVVAPVPHMLEQH